MLPVEQPFKAYSGLDGKPLDNGYVYFGLPDQDPVAKPVTVFWDAAGTLPAAQPLRTVNGYIMNAGTPANVFFDGAYSELVKDSKGRQVFYSPTSDSFSVASAIRTFLASIGTSVGATLVGFIQAGVGAVSRTLQAKLRDSVCVKDFGAKGDGVTDDSAAIQAAINTGAIVMFTKDVYCIGSQLNLSNGTVIQGNGCVIRPTVAGMKAFYGPTTAQDVHITGVNITAAASNCTGFYIESARTWITECTTYGVALGVVSRAASFYLTTCDIRAVTTSVLMETVAEVRSVCNCILTAGGAVISVNGGAGLRFVNCDILAGTYGMLVAPSVDPVTSIKMVGCFLDQGINGGLKILPTGTGTVRRLKFDSVWFVGSSAGDGVAIGGNVAGLQFSNCEMYGNSGNGLSAGAGVADITITGCHVSGNTSRGLTFGSVNGITVTGCTIGPSSGFPGNGVGIELTGTTDNYLYTMNRIAGNGVNVADGATGTHKLTAPNLS